MTAPESFILSRLVPPPRALNLRRGAPPVVHTTLYIQEHGCRLSHGEVGLEILYMEQSLFEFSVEFSLSVVAVGHVATDGNTIGVRSYSRVQISTNVVAHYNMFRYYNEPSVSKSVRSAKRKASLRENARRARNQARARVNALYIEIPKLMVKAATAPSENGRLRY
jgi:hypothetical protein